MNDQNRSPGTNPCTWETLTNDKANNQNSKEKNGLFIIKDVPTISYPFGRK